MRRGAERLIERLTLVLLGAFLILIYLNIALDPVPALVERLGFYIPIAWLLAAILGGALAWQRRKTARPPTDVTPAHAATSVVIATGFAAAFHFGVSGSRDFTLAAGIALVTLAIAWFVYRFARQHEAEIGEARFKTLDSTGDRTI